MRDEEVLEAIRRLVRSYNADISHERALRAKAEQELADTRLELELVKQQVSR